MIKKSNLTIEQQRMKNKLLKKRLIKISKRKTKVLIERLKTQTLNMIQTSLDFESKLKDCQEKISQLTPDQEEKFKKLVSKDNKLQEFFNKNIIPINEKRNTKKNKCL